MNDRVRSELLCTTKFDENSDLRMMYLGSIDMSKLDNSGRKVSYIRTRVYSR